MVSWSGGVIVGRLCVAIRSSFDTSMDELLEVAESFLAAEHEMALVEIAGAEAALHRFAEDDVFILDLIDEAHEIVYGGVAHGIGEAVIVNCQRAVGIDRHE